MGYQVIILLKMNQRFQLPYGFYLTTHLSKVQDGKENLQRAPYVYQKEQNETKQTNTRILTKSWMEHGVRSQDTV